MNYITPKMAKKILLSKDNYIFLNLDLYKTNKLEKIIIKDEKAIFPEGEVDFKTLKKIAKDNTLYFLKDNHLYKAAISTDEGFYKLVPTIPPTIEISGIRMHRTKEVNPYQDTLNKVNSINIKKGDIVLDTCMGLGYTAIESYKRGADVTTIEKNRYVLELAKINPYSEELFKGDIKVLLGDSFDKIKEFEDETFTAIIHDPPRFSLAGHLYSEEFYKELYRVLKDGGRLFHYVGNPGKKYRGKDLQKGVMERLRRVGFKSIKRVPNALGVIAKKI
ncbi:class I SAM-dependent methyltransferase [Methanocaldococcus indicus]|uniref:class I SAM-dependent methyltransferase n=1 Tax=Methanocaldococcus indicus TaxID=213231 RepID=UPI003C6D628F